MLTRRTSAIQIHISALHDQLEVYRGRIEELEELMNSVKLKRDSAVADRAALTKKKAELEMQALPVNWIPPELLISIFQEVVDGNDNMAIDPAVTISHVCQRWRSISVRTPELWHKLSFPRFYYKRSRLATLLARSGDTQLDVLWIGPEGVDSDVQEFCVSDVTEPLELSKHRIRSIQLHTNCIEPSNVLRDFLYSSPNSFTALTSLDISVLPYSGGGVYILFHHEGHPRYTPALWCKLKHLKLQNIPISGVPTPFFANLVDVELHYALKAHYFTLSSLHRLITLAPKLEALTLVECAPRNDIIEDEQTGSLTVRGTGNTAGFPITPLEHIQLRSLDWTLPDAVEVHQVLALFNFPHLEKINILVDRRARVPTLTTPRGYSMNPSRKPPVELPEVRKLCLESVDEESAHTAVRRLSLPRITHLELANVDKDVRLSLSPLPSFPRLEHIFRDPRLTSLTHLTVSFYTFREDCDAVLGYMANLQSLTFEACLGVDHMLNVLRQVPVGSRNLKRCPFLEEIILWSCSDATYDMLANVIKIRAGDIIPTDVPTRKIKPLRKVRGGEAKSKASTSIQKCRIEGCGGITEMQAMSLSLYGVTVRWEQC